MKKKIIGITFPRADKTLGLEPSILTVLPDGDNVYYDVANEGNYKDEEVELYLASVYISGIDEFRKWSEGRDKFKMVIGGYQPTMTPEWFLNDASKIVVGLCDDLQATIEQPGQIVNGICSYKRTPRRDLYSILEFNQQIIPDKKPEDVVVSINTSSGCPMSCDFCCTPVMSSKLKSTPMDLLKMECDELATYNPAYIFIRDENFTLQRDWKERLKIVNESMPNTKIYTFASANTLKEPTIKYMAEHNVYMVCLGLEEPTKNYIKNKKLDEVTAMLKRYGIMVYMSFIIDPLKTITEEDEKTLYSILEERIIELKPEMVCGNFLMPFPGTPLWDNYKEKVTPEMYKYYNSKIPFLVGDNKDILNRQKYQMYRFQWDYFNSEFYNKNIRTFRTGDTLDLRFRQLNCRFDGTEYVDEARYATFDGWS